MTKATCSIDDCDRPSFSRGWCHAHYNRWLRKGTTDGPPIQSRRAGCLVDECSAKHWGHGYCQTHLYRLKANGDPEATRSPGLPAGESNPTRQSDVDYSAMHARLRRSRGRAADYYCIECGAPAQHWAYQHTSECELVGSNGLPYSLDPKDYEPMCPSCHHRMDMLRGWVRPGTRGVSFHKQAGKWRAYATIDGRQHSAGLHSTREQAQVAADELRARLLGEWRATA